MRPPLESQYNSFCRAVRPLWGVSRQSTAWTLVRLTEDFQIWLNHTAYCPHCCMFVNIKRRIKQQSVDGIVIAFVVELDRHVMLNPGKPPPTWLDCIGSYTHALQYADEPAEIAIHRQLLTEHVRRLTTIGLI
jgi:hypothetical protein